MNAQARALDPRTSSAATPLAPWPGDGGWRRALRVLTAFGMLLLATGVSADLMLFPTRIVFDRNDRSAQIDLVNNGTDTATYRIVFERKRMSEDGSFATVDQPLPGEQFADEMVRYSPRQVVLAPGAEQTVRLLLRKPADLAPGEYRSHLVFQRLPDATSPAAGDTAAPAELDIRLRALIGVSIPVIVRHGQTSAAVEVSAVGYHAGASHQLSYFEFDLVRTGNRSVYGDLVVFFTPRGGTERIVSQSNGVAVYTPNTLRRIRMALQPDVPWPLAGGTLRVIYRGRPEDGGRLLAESTAETP